jgi:hypothetical protein
MWHSTHVTPDAEYQRCGEALQVLGAEMRRSTSASRSEAEALTAEKATTHPMRLVRALSVPVAAYLPMLESPEEVLSSNLA